MKKIIITLPLTLLSLIAYCQRDYRPSGGARAAGNALGTIILFGGVALVIGIVKSLSNKK